MKLELNVEQYEIAAVARKFLEQEVPLPRVRQLADGGSPLAIDESVWAQCASMGWFGLGIPESSGGVGYGPIEEFALFKELGRHLAPGPYASTVIAGWVAAAAGQHEIAAALVSGARRAGLVVDGFVFDAEAGGLVVELDATEARIREVSDLVAVPSVDASVRLGQAALGPAIASATHPLIFARAQVLYSAMELGIAEAVRDLSVQYAKDRYQFGVPIGTFQAVKHRCSDMAIRVHAAQAQTLFAALHIERRAPEASFHAASAKLVATNAAKLNTADNVQNHGAIGFTVEHDSGLFARRAHMHEFALGGRKAAGPLTLAPARHGFAGFPDAPADWFAGV